MCMACTGVLVNGKILLLCACRATFYHVRDITLEAQLGYHAGWGFVTVIPGLNAETFNAYAPAQVMWLSAADRYFSKVDSQCCVVE